MSSTCSDDQIYLINFASENELSLTATIVAGNQDFYIYPLPQQELLVISKNNKRNIKLTIYDNSLPVTPEKIRIFVKRFLGRF